MDAHTRERKRGTCIRESAEIHYTDTDCVSFQCYSFLYLPLYIYASLKSEKEKNGEHRVASLLICGC